jgi:hypothetical protein
VQSSASTITAGESASLHFTTSPSTPPGTYLITISGTGSSTTHQAEYTLEIVAHA